MKQTFAVNNVKCGGCAHTLKTKLAAQFGDVEVNLDKMPREITLDIEEEQLGNLKQALRKTGYPLVDDELSAIENIETKAKSFVSCAIGKMNT